MSSQRSSRLQLPKKPKCISAPARASKRDQEQVDEAKRLSLQTPAASVGAAGHVNGAGDSAKRPLHKKLMVADDGASAEHKDGRKEEGSPDGFVVHLDGSSPSVPARNERSRTASKKRQLLADSSNDDDGGRRSGSEQSAADESDGEASSDFSGAESESCEDEDSDVADSEDEEEKKVLAKKPKQVKAMAAAPRPKAAQQKSSTAAAQAKSSSAAACRTQASAPVARSGPAAKAQDPSQKRAATKGGAAPLSGAQEEVRQPLQPQVALNMASTSSAPPVKQLPHSKGSTAAASAAAAAAATAVPGTSEQTPTLKRIKPGASLAAILSGGPVYRVPGLRRAGGIKLHNVGPNRE